MVGGTATGRVRGIVRSVRGSNNGETDELTNPWIAGAAVLLVLALPLIPFLLIVWSIAKTLKGVRKRVSWE